MQPAAPPTVAWQYGSGNGDGVQSSQKAVYSRAYGAGNGDGVQNASKANTRYGYGADGMSGTMISVAPPTQQMMAAPAPAPAPVVLQPTGAPGTHS